MKELGMVVMGCLIFLGFFSTVIYPDLEYKGYSSVQNCSGECYEEYVRLHGSVVDQLKEKAERDLAAPFSSIRGLWSGCDCRSDVCNYVGTGGSVISRGYRNSW